MRFDDVHRVAAVSPCRPDVGTDLKGGDLKSRKAGLSPLKTGRDLSALTPQPQPSPTTSASTSSSSTSRIRRKKWHFGIRSKSAPMEVMAEIYRACAAIGFEWKTKGADWEKLFDQPPPPGPDSRRSRKEEEERQKKMQDIFFIECRTVIDGVQVRPRLPPRASSAL